MILSQSLLALKKWKEKEVNFLIKDHVILLFITHSPGFNFWDSYGETPVVKVDLV